MTTEPLTPPPLITAYTTKIQFKGLILFRAGANPVEAILPVVDGDAYIGRHDAYVAFKTGSVLSSDWTTAPLPDHSDYSAFRLTGETIYLNTGGGPLQFNSFLPKVTHYCPTLQNLSANYSTHGSPYAAAHVVLTGGDVGWYVSNRYRIETVIDMVSATPLVLTGIKNGRARSLTFKADAELVIANYDRYATGPTKDFLFYYRMFDIGGACTGIPDQADAMNNPNPKSPVIPDIGALDIACSNSQYP